jgi:hypothetical protein
VRRFNEHGARVDISNRVVMGVISGLLSLSFAAAFNNTQANWQATPIWQHSGELRWLGIRDLPRKFSQR